MTITPSQLNINDAPVEAFPHGALAEYSQEELKLSQDVQRLDLSLTTVENDWRMAVVQLKLKLDGEQLTAGESLGGGANERSRFWRTCERGDHGGRLQHWAETGNRKSVARWVDANESAKLFTKSAVTHVTATLPLSAALEQGIKLSTLEIISGMNDRAKELVQDIYDTTGTVKADMAKECVRVVKDYPELIEKVSDGIRNHQYRVPNDVHQLCSKYREHKAAQASAERERKLIEQRSAAEAQAEANRKLSEELAAKLPDEPKDAPVPSQGAAPTPAPNKPQVLTTYPVQDLLDGIAFEGLQKRYKTDTDDFFTDMRELYAAMRVVDQFTDKWAERLQDQHLSGHKSEMLLWETYSVAWNRLGKFKKLGGKRVNSVPEFWALIGELCQRAKGATARCMTYSQLNVKKYGPFEIAETTAEHYQPGRID